MLFMGIDPGLKGGIALLETAGPHDSFMMGTLLKLRTYVTPLKDGKYDIPKIHDFLGREMITFCAIEKQQPVYMKGGHGTVASFSVGYGYGMWITLLTTLNIPFKEVLPKEWQVSVFIEKKGKPKDKALATAIKLYPNYDFRATERCTTLHDGIIDASLIAEYARRTYD